MVLGIETNKLRNVWRVQIQQTPQIKLYAHEEVLWQR